MNVQTAATLAVAQISLNAIRAENYIVLKVYSAMDAEILEIGNAQFVDRKKAGVRQERSLKKTRAPMMISPMKTEPNQSPQTTICTVTECAPSRTFRASADRV